MTEIVSRQSGGYLHFPCRGARQTFFSSARSSNTSSNRTFSTSCLLPIAVDSYPVIVLSSTFPVETTKDQCCNVIVKSIGVKYQLGREQVSSLLIVLFESIAHR